jgi:hypothetical protein
MHTFFSDLGGDMRVLDPEGLRIIPFIEGLIICICVLGDAEGATEQ